MTGLKEKLSAVISEEELKDKIMDIVRIPTYLGVPGQETPAAEYVKSICDAEGIECTVQEVEDGRSNVYARLKGTGGGKTLLFNGHLDTVDLQNMPKGCEPWIEDGKIYGRGTSDMKGPDICMLMAMVALKRAGIKLPGDVLFCGSADEEMNSIGAIDAIKKGIKADGAVIGEPTDFGICTAHRGLEWYEFHFIGKTVHGGNQAEGINAIFQAMKFVQAVKDELAPAVFARKHPILKEATVNVGIIKGGTGLSTVPGDCTVWVDRRFLPAEKYEEVGKEFQDILDKLAAEDPTFKCEMKVMDVSVMKPGYVHMPMETDRKDPIVLSAKKAVSEALEEEPNVTFFPAWTDAGLFRTYAGIPTIVYGPGLLANCHSGREFIPLEHLKKGCLAYALIAADFCS
jgi:acetylornithine deacetylase/succinyl-diaminopimelate desuccinylase family protein